MTLAPFLQQRSEQVRLGRCCAYSSTHRLRTGTALYNKDSTAAVLQALKAGYTHLDCAESYDNEQATGDAIRQSGLARSRVWVTTKCGSVRQGADGSSERDGFDPRKSLLSSLKKVQSLPGFGTVADKLQLQLDYVDLFLVR
jgi:diketogulonate reductase-like aldo/keto reductase